MLSLPCLVPDKVGNGILLLFNFSFNVEQRSPNQADPAFDIHDHFSTKLSKPFNKLIVFSALDRQDLVLRACFKLVQVCLKFSLSSLQRFRLSIDLCPINEPLIKPVCKVAQFCLQSLLVVCIFLSEGLDPLSQVRVAILTCTDQFLRNFVYFRVQSLVLRG